MTSRGNAAHAPWLAAAGPLLAAALAGAVLAAALAGGLLRPDEARADDATASPEPTRTVVIDAGHQSVVDRRTEPLGPGSGKLVRGITLGTRGWVTRAMEYRRNLQVALLLRDALEAAGYRVVMVRTASAVDITNRERALLGNSEGADLVVRLHCDGFADHSVRGITTLVPGKNRWTGPIVGPSRAAGRLIQEAAVAATGARDRGVVGRTDLVGFNWSEVPTVLVEMGFLSNRDEDRKLATASYRGRLARGIAAGVSEYLGQ